MEKRPHLSTEIILDIAFELAEKNGIDTVTYNGLARELGIRPQSMYRYIPDIRFLRVHLLTRFLEELTDKLEASMRGLAPVDALRAFAVTMYDECHEDPRYYETFELMHQYDVIAQLNSPLLRLGALVQTRMAEQIRDPEDAARLTQLFVAINLGYAQMAMTRFAPASLADSRGMFIRSIEEFLKKIIIKY